MLLSAFDKFLPQVQGFHHIDRRPVSDILILSLYEGESLSDASSSVPELKDYLEGVLKTGDFRGKLGETICLYHGIAERRILLLGLGKKDELNLERIKQAYFRAFCFVSSTNSIRQVVVALPQDLSFEFTHLLSAFLEGFYYSLYDFTRYKADSAKGVLKEVSIACPSRYVLSEIESLIQEKEALFRAHYFVRDLVNANADDLHPEALVDAAFGVSRKYPEVEYSVLEQKQIEELGMGLFLAVSKGSAYPPYLLHLRYRGRGGHDDTTLFIGKAITFDTGGLHLKPNNSMDTMRCDMAGGAVLLGLLSYLASQKAAINIDVIIPVCENALGSKAFKPGDMIKSMKGLHVEITSTDAEGRLCLADAMTYGIRKIEPSRVIDIATLTGSMEIALGSDISGYLSNSETLAEIVDRASKASGELFWRMPLYRPYRDLLKSDLADIKSTGGRIGGAILAALFLEEFVENRPWVHIDIAGTAYMKESKRYLSKGATGVGLRMLVDLCKNLSL